MSRKTCSGFKAVFTYLYMSCKDATQNLQKYARQYLPNIQLRCALVCVDNVWNMDRERGEKKRKR